MQKPFSFLRIYVAHIIPLLILSANSYAQSVPTKTALVIVGTIHPGNKAFDHRTLYQLLEKHNPDVILYEQSEEYNRVFGLRTASFLRIWKPGIEQLALQKYTKHHPSVMVLPFDIPITKKKSYIKDLDKNTQNFYDAMNEAYKSTSDSLRYADYAEKYNAFYAQLNQEDLVAINQPDMVKIPGQLDSLQRTVILPLAQKYLTDTMLVKKYEEDLAFWIERNDYMVKAIENYTKTHAGKRIVVLTGLFHKYYLLDGLRPLAGEQLVIKELTD